MKKSISHKKTYMIFIFVALFLVCGNIAVYAGNEGILPCNNNTASTSTVFTISSSGTATASVGYTGYAGVTSGGRIETKMQKKILGLFWQNVDNGTWIDSASGAHYRNSHKLQLTSKGTYRIAVEYTIYGSGGAADKIESEIIKSY